MKLFINVNENIKVKIKPAGYQHMMDRHNDLVKDLPSTAELTHDMNYYKSKEDENGYTTMQLHVFMAVFGSFCEGSFVVPFETEILIEKGL